MSYDLAMATRTRPKPDAIEAFARAAGAEIRTVGAFKPGSNVLVTFGPGYGGGRTIDVDGPNAVEIDDLPDDLAATRITFVQAPPSEPAEAIPWIN
jgi:hypothetical protein